MTENIAKKRSRLKSKSDAWRFNIEMRDRIQALLDTRGITVKELASRIGVNMSTFGNYFAADTKFPCSVVRMIAEELDVSVDYLYGMSRSENRDLEDNSVDACDALHQAGLSEQALDMLSGFDEGELATMKQLQDSGVLKEVVRILSDFETASGELGTKKAAYVAAFELSYMLEQKYG